MSERKRLVQEVWPDKLLYATVMLLIVGGLGVLYGMLIFFIDFAYSTTNPVWAILNLVPGFVTAPIAAVSAFLAYKALENHDTRYGLWAALVGVASLGMVFLGSLFSLVALVLILLSKKEKEGEYAEGQEFLEPHMWPDKSLAASLLLLVTGVICLAWGGVIYMGMFSLEQESSEQILGGINLGVGTLLVISSQMVYRQRGMVLAYVSAILTFITFGAYILAPAMAIAALVLLRLARKEREFDHGPTPDPTTA